MPKKSFAIQSRVPLAGSTKTAFAPAKKTVAAPPSSSVTVSVIVCRRKNLKPSAVAKGNVSRSEFKNQYAADPAAVKAVAAFAKEYGLKSEVEPERRTVYLTGTAAQVQQAFSVSLHLATDDAGNTYRVREGDIHIPESLSGMVQAVLGLDNRPQARPQFRIAKSGKQATRSVRASAVNTTYTPVEVAELYGLPQGASANGQTIGILELGGGYKTSDIKAYFKDIGLNAPKVTAVLVDKGKNKPSGANGADGEVMLDIEVAAAVAGGADIAVYFAPNTDQGFLDALTTAIHDKTNKPSVISISWGGPESTWTAQAMSAMDEACQSAAALGITIVAAAGDNGSSDGVNDGSNHVDFPASSPNVLACGGTKLLGTATDGTISSEVVWNETAANEGATGGGISSIFPQPSYQSGIAATTAGRGVPDVAGNADPSTGYQVRVDGENVVIGGTSAVAPLWAALVAILNASGKNNAGLIQPKLYGSPSVFRDITEGDNGAFSAGPGWDACTGLGSPNVANLLQMLTPGKKVKKGKSSAKSEKKAVKKSSKKASGVSI